MNRNVTGGRSAAQLRRLARSGASFLVAATVGSCLTVPTEPVQGTEPTRGLFHFQWSGHDESSSPLPHGFLLDRGSATPLALTAHHVAGPFMQSPPGTTTAWLRSPVLPIAKVRLGPRLPIPGARVIGGGDSQHDIAAFRVIDWKPSRALRLATQAPAVGDTVFVLAVHIGGAINPHPLSGPRQHPARVDVVDDSAFVYTYLASANANFTSGAAVLDKEGRVVGLNVGTNILQASQWQVFRNRFPTCCITPVGGEVVGLGVSLTSLRTHLDPIP